MTDSTPANNDDLLDPTDLGFVNECARAWAAEGETVNPIGIQRIIIADDALDALRDEVRARAGNGHVLMVADRTPMRRGDDDVKGLVEDALARGGPLSVSYLHSEPRKKFHAHKQAAERLAVGMGDFAAVVAVGSGSVTDTVKYARRVFVARVGRPLPLVCFPTAASVTAYTSASSVLTVDGVKRTLPSGLPEAIVCDLRTLADAPRAMTQAGFGDVMARRVAFADWFLAAQLGMDNGFSEVPNRMLTAAERTMIHRAEGVAAGDIAAVRSVTEALLLAGMAMTVVGQTAPISGWEHVISHFLDLTAAHDGRETALHGAQVGVATLISASAYHRAWKQINIDRLSSGEQALDRDTIRRTFGRYDATGGLVDEIWRDLEIKQSHWRAAASARSAFAQRYRAGEFADFPAQVVGPVSQIEDALRSAGAPRRFTDLDEPVSADNAQAALRHAHLVRSRFTLGDLLDRTGWLTDANAAGLLEEPCP